MDLVYCLDCYSFVHFKIVNILPYPVNFIFLFSWKMNTLQRYMINAPYRKENIYDLYYALRLVFQYQKFEFVYQPFTIYIIWSTTGLPQMEFCPTCGILLQYTLPHMGHPSRFFCPTCPYICHIESKVTLSIKPWNTFLFLGLALQQSIYVCFGTLFTGQDKEKATFS